MNIQKPVSWLACALILVSLNACASVRYTSTLKSSGDKSPQLGNARVSLVAVSIETNREGMGNDTWTWGSTRDIVRRAKDLRPDIFTDEWTGLPVTVKIREDMSTGMMELASFLSGLTLGTIPFPGRYSYAYTVETSLSDALGKPMPTGRVDLEMSQVMWWTLLLPLGLIDIPGQADLPRERAYLTPPYWVDPSARAREYASDCMVEAIVKSLAGSDRAQLAAAYQARASRLQEITLDGRQCWSFLMPKASSEKGQADVMTASLYQDLPRRDARPFEEAVVARRDGSGAWQPVSTYLRHARSLTAVSVLMDNGVPAKAVVRAVDEPPLEDFIDTPDLSDADRAGNLRWSNGMLLEAKNRSLERLLREEGHGTLLTLATRIEKSILDLSEQAERAKDSAQAKVEQGGDPGPNRELSVLCRQRIEILKPVLTVIKDAAARKQ